MFTPASSTTGASKDWIFVSASVSFRQNLMDYYATIGFNGYPSITSTTPYTTLTTPLVHDSSDKVIVGGPSGTLATVYRIKIYSPGTHFISPSNQFFALTV